MEFTIDRILRDDIKICQPKKGGFRFGRDSVLLAYFARMKKTWLAADVGSGSAVIASICAKIYGTSFTAIELQETMFNCLTKTVALCGLEDKIFPVLGNVKDFKTPKRFDAVICNPPYRKAGTGHVNPDIEERIARFSYEMSIKDLAEFCRRNLKHRGKLFFSYDSDMINDAMEICRKERLEPKRLRFVHPDIKTPAKLVLIECIFGGGKETLIEPPLFQKGNGEEEREYENIFKGEWL